MVFSSVIALTVAQVSAERWQQISCIPPPERISSRQLLDLVCCFPLQQLGRFALCIWTFLCLPPPDSFYSYNYYDSSSSSSSSEDYDDDYGGGDALNYGCYGGCSYISDLDDDEDDYYYYNPHSD